MIDLNDFIIKETLRKKPRYMGEMNKCKYYKCSCPGCNISLGYISKSRYANKKSCNKCSLVKKQTMKKNHWSKTGTYYPPKTYKTDAEKKIKYERELAYNRQYYKQYYQDNKEGIRASRYVFLQNNIEAKLAKNLRTRLYQAIKGNKGGSAVSDLGCSIGELKKHLEAQFQEGMNWDNWSRAGWHIDHIKSLASFDLTNKGQFKEACHYTNLQPMWAKDNLSKGSS